MIYWLWRDNSALSSTIEPLVVREGTISNLWCEDSLKDVLMNCKNQTEVSFSICFFVDAFDEIESDAASRDGMIRFMKDLVSDSVQGHGRFKMCIASRPENEIAIHFRHFRGFCLQDWTADDIRKFVHARLDAHPNARATHRSSSYDETLQRICGDIIGAAQGVFLWVRVVVDHVLSSQTGGESLSEIRQRILDLRNENLSQYFVRILEKTPKETRELTNALFQMLLTSQEPPSILTIGVLLDIVKRRQEPQERHLITEERLLEISTASDISSRISNLTGGLVQVISNDSGHPEATRLPGSNGREVSSSHDRVRFLHASVKDFLRTPEAKSLLESNAFLSSTRKTGPMYNGNVLNLCVADAYLGLDPDHRRSSGWALDAMEITMHHAPAIEASFDDSSLELLLRIFRDLSRQHECTWDMGMPAWNTTFLAFAVAHRMHKFVRKCLNERGFKVRKEGRPLLHYAAWAPGCYPDVTMARILVNAGTSLNKRFKEPAHHGAKTALETLNFKEMEQDGQSHVDFIKFFIEEGAEVTRPIPCGDGPMLVGWFQRAPGIPRHIQRPPWSTVLHIIAEGPIRGAQKMEILKQIPHSRHNDKRADGFTVFGLVLKSGMSGPTSITIEEAGELISLGALITRRIVDMGPPTRELVEQHSRFRYGAWRRRKSLMKDGQLGE
ncbi:hypothetical protein K456DRAFT_1730790 [Colletotrichum gloeosporioides 23]|nr:hypothetical protein K456DRAFT_1730790 [Colletotrichum gloeosporioides 23]